MTHISPRLLSVLIVILSALLLTGCGTQNTDAASTTSDTTQNTNTELADLKNLLPERGAEISGTVKKVVGNIYSIETIDMSGVEWIDPSWTTNIRAQMEWMSDEERTTFTQKMREARENAPTITVEVLVPAWIPISVTQWWRWWFGWWGWGVAWGRWAAGWGGWAAPQWIGWAITTTPTTPQQTPTAKMWTLEDIQEWNSLTIRISETDNERKIAERVNVQQ